jgi:membrane-bound lytic murein transglycosylase B
MWIMPVLMGRSRHGVRTLALGLTTALALMLGRPAAQDQAPGAPPDDQSAEAADTEARSRAQAFSDFLGGIREEARAQGIADSTLDLALANLAPTPVVVARDRAQPEQTQTLDAYLAQRITTRTIRNARQQVTTHRALLARVEAASGVPPALLVAIWGLESNFGRFTGTYPTIQALATLAFDGRRPLFRTELLAALTMLDRQQATLEQMKGSWAGAMGQPQFMPSSFLRHAVDFDEDGRIDIWTSMPDVFGSMGRYLQAEGWHAGERWGREVRVTRAAVNRIERDVPMRTSGCRAIRELTEPRPLAVWQRLGVRLPGGRALPAAALDASLVRGQRRAFLVYRNFEAVLDYNCSNAYAIAVGVLADRLAGG